MVALPNVSVGRELYLEDATRARKLLSPERANLTQFSVDQQAKHRKDSMSSHTTLLQRYPTIVVSIHYFVADYQTHLSLLAKCSYLHILSAQKFLLAIIFSEVQKIACPLLSFLDIFYLPTWPLRIHRHFSAN